MQDSVIRTAFGLTCNMERAHTPGGFQPALIHPPSGEELFGEARIVGFAAFMRMHSSAKLMLLGGQEPGKSFHESHAIREVLVAEYGIEASRIVACISGYGTAEAVDYIVCTACEGDVVISSCYHLRRIQKLLELQKACTPC